MKHLSGATLLLLITVSLSSCDLLFGVKGKGEIQTFSRTTPAFDGIQLDVPGKLIIIPGMERKVEIKTQQNISEVITTEVDNNILTVDFNERVKSFDELTIYITMPSVTEIGITGSGQVHTQGKLSSTELNVNIMGSGEAHLELTANAVNGEISGSGQLILKGNASECVFDITGSGYVNASEFKVVSAEVDVTGSGSAEVYATTTLDGKVTGSGTVYYLGDPEIKTNVTGSGKVAHKTK